MDGVVLDPHSTSPEIKALSTRSTLTGVRAIRSLFCFPSHAPVAELMNKSSKQQVLHNKQNNNEREKSKTQVLAHRARNVACASHTSQAARGSSVAGPCLPTKPEDTLMIYLAQQISFPGAVPIKPEIEILSIPYQPTDVRSGRPEPVDLLEPVMP